MTFDFTEKGEVKIKIDEYIERMINYFSMKISNSDMTLTTDGNNLFEKGNRKRLSKK